MARPQKTTGECPAEKNPVWAREDGECHRVKNPARPARPGATALALMSVSIIPVWARGATEAGACHREKNPVWARVWVRVWARDAQDK